MHHKLSPSFDFWKRLKRLWKNAQCISVAKIRFFSFIFRLSFRPHEVITLRAYGGLTGSKLAAAGKMRAISGQPESKQKKHNNNETELRECTPKTGLNRSLGRLFPHAVHKIAFDSTFCRAEFKSPDFRPLGWPGQDTGLCDTGPEEPGAGWRAGSSYRTLSLLLPCFVRDVLCCKTIFLLNLGFPIFAGPCPHGFRLWGCCFLSSLLPRSFYLYACILGFIHRWSPKKQKKTGWTQTMFNILRARAIKHIA